MQVLILYYTIKKRYYVSLVMKYKFKNSKSNLERLYFFLGLLEGDGSIQVNHWKKRYLQFRIVIKLKNTTANYEMLAEFRDFFNPIFNLTVSKNNQNILLMQNDQRKLKLFICLIESYTQGFLLTKYRKRYSFFCYALSKKIN